MISLSLRKSLTVSLSLSTTRSFAHTPHVAWAEIPFDFQIEDHVIAGEHLAVADTTPDDYVRVMMNCWRFDANDRPEFTTLIQQLEAIPLIEGSPERVPGAAGNSNNSFINNNNNRH